MQRKSPTRNAVRRWLSIGVVLLCVCTQAVSQQKVEAGTTLHVYTNLLQIPVLILNSGHQPVPFIEPDKFLLHIDRNPPFRPRVRLEGEDPITLAVLIDGASEGPKLLDLSENLASMAHDQLHRQDRIAFYGLDGCKLRRTSTLRSPDANTVRAAVKTLEAVPPYVHHWHGEKCESPIALWDALAWVSHSLQGEPGRRVILVITNGADGGSRLTADETRLVATSNGVAVFALAERYKVHQGDLPSNAVLGGNTASSALAFVSEGSGGMVMESTRKDLDTTLARFPQLLRERYIVEFSRPAGMTAGQHSLIVTVGQSKDFIRNAGTSMPVADPEVADPAVQHGAVDPTFKADVGDSQLPETKAVEGVVSPARVTEAQPAGTTSSAP